MAVPSDDNVMGARANPRMSSESERFFVAQAVTENRLPKHPRMHLPERMAMGVSGWKLVTVEYFVGNFENKRFHCLSMNNKRRVD